MISMKKALVAFTFGVVMTATPALAAPDADTCQAWVDECHAGDANACYQFNRLASYCHYYGIFL